MPKLHFIRYAVDDLKAFAYEARMAQRPRDDEEALHRWFWSSMGIAALIRAVAARGAESEEGDVQMIVKGLVR